MAANVPEPVDRGDAPTGVIISSILAIGLALLIGLSAMGGRPRTTLPDALTSAAAAAAAQPTAAPVQATRAPAAPAAAPKPAATVAASTDGPPPEPRPGNAANGQRLFVSQGCSGCHAIPRVSEANVGPSLANIGNLAATRRPGYSAGQYLYESITNTNAFIVPNYQPNVMPATFATLPPQQINDLVAYLLQQKR